MASKKPEKAEKPVVSQESAKEEKLKALERAMAELDKQFGAGTVMKLGDSKLHQNIASIPTGILTLDAALGIGGVPRGRIVEIFGPESSGKTTVALHIVAQAQKAGGFCAFVDAEHALDPTYAALLGVNIQRKSALFLGYILCTIALGNALCRRQDDQLGFRSVYRLAGSFPAEASWATALWVFRPA